jgi:hypothetical protein
MTKREFYNHPGWRWCTARGARDQVLLLGRQTTFREKLEWLEEAETLALRMRANPRKKTRAATSSRKAATRKQK